MQDPVSTFERHDLCPTRTDPFRFVILIRNGQCRPPQGSPALSIGALGKGVRDPLSIIRKEQRRLIFRPIDDVEKHSTPNHFSFESSSVFHSWVSRMRNLQSAPRSRSASSAASAPRMPWCIMVKLAFVNARQMMRPERLTDGYGSPRASLGRPLVGRDFW